MYIFFKKKINNLKFVGLKFLIQIANPFYTTLIFLIYY